MAAFLLRRRSTELPRFTDQRYLLRFTACAVLAAPTAAGILFATAYWLWMRISPWYPLFTWITTDGLGTAVVAPACISLFSSHLRQPRHWRTYWYLPATLIADHSYLVLSGTRPGHLSHLPHGRAHPLSLGTRVGFDQHTFCHAGRKLVYDPRAGLFSRALELPSREARRFCLQLYIATGMFLVLAAASVLDTLRATERRLARSCLFTIL